MLFKIPMKLPLILIYNLSVLFCFNEFLVGGFCLFFLEWRWGLCTLFLVLKELIFKERLF